MELRLFSAKSYDRDSFDAANDTAGHNLSYVDARLAPDTAVLAPRDGAVCAFVNDDLGAEVLDVLGRAGRPRCGAPMRGLQPRGSRRGRGALGIRVVRVPAYSPNAVAEHTLALILALNRKIPKAYNRVREGNFALEGLLGFDLAGKTAGVIGTGLIGSRVARLLWHLRCDVVAYDPYPDAGLQELGVRYVGLEELLGASDVVSLNCPLTARDPPPHRCRRRRADEAAGRCW